MKVRDGKFYVVEICSTESLMYGARICAHISIYRFSGKEQVTFAYTQNRRSGRRENRLDTRLHKTYSRTSRARVLGNYAHVQPCEKGTESAKGE